MRRSQIPTEEIRLLSLHLAKDIISQFSQSLKSNNGNATDILQALAQEINKVSDEVLTIDEAAEMFGISVAAMKQRCKTINGKKSDIPFYDNHGHKYFSRLELTKYLLRRRLYK